MDGVLRAHSLSSSGLGPHFLSLAQLQEANPLFLSGLEMMFWLVGGIGGSIATAIYTAFTDTHLIIGSSGLPLGLK